MRHMLLPLLLSGVLYAQVAEFRVRETAGLRRFSYPVRAKFQTAIPPESLRLLENEKAIPAQFSSLEGRWVEADFNVSLGPFEALRYRVEEGHGPAVKAGLAVEETGRTFIVRYPAKLEFHVPKDLQGLLDAVSAPRGSYLSGGSRGLVLTHAAGEEPARGRWRARIVKAGPLAALLRFENTEEPPGGRGVTSVVEMEFPLAKSWVEVRWTLKDPERRITGMAAELNLLLDEGPVLADFGAGSMIYAALRPGQGACLQAEPHRSGGAAWQIDAGGRPYAAGRGPVEGWAHVMDERRATAVAVADFAAPSRARRDSIGVSADGRLLVRRDFGPARLKSLTFWLHFVDTPVQIGAATSPQSMQHPPRVE